MKWELSWEPLSWYRVKCRECPTRIDVAAAPGKLHEAVAEKGWSTDLTTTNAVWCPSCAAQRS